MKKRLNLVTAREILTDMVKASGAGAFKSYTIREWIDEWIETKEPSVTKSSLSTYRTITKRFLESIKERAGSPLESITTADIREFRSQINKRSTASNSNKYIKVLNALFSDAVNEHLTLHNPVSPLKGKPLPETDSIQRHPFTIEDVSKLIKAAPSSEWEGMILLGAYAGLRIRDAANLTTDNLSEGSIILTPEKTKAKGKTVEIPLHSTLSEFFTRNPPSPFPNTPLFPTLQGKVTGGRDGLSTQFATIQKAAKIPKTRTIKSKKGTLTFHSLRHSFVSWMSNAEVRAE
ncbi:MAG: tyrosine-type recombinase/integrase, partial [Akkermansiaceae bacterium]